MLSRLDTLVQWLIKLPQQEKNVKALLSMRIQLMKQFKSTEWVVNDELTIAPDYLKRSLAIIKNMFTSMITKVQRFQQSQQGQK
ncbi:Mediator complex, subunit Med15 [Penicillium occitanis (nom. inval.)]|nr:Mediator complex, subunit Med15 [Penicillium occitanis (nom. inval.)]